MTIVIIALILKKVGITMLLGIFLHMIDKTLMEISHGSMVAFRKNVASFNSMYINDSLIRSFCQGLSIYVVIYL